MAGDVGRAVGAADLDPIKIAGKEVHIRGLSIKELTEVERECLKQYKRNYLETYSNNLDLLPEAERVGLLKEKMEEAARWDVGDLPLRFAYDPDTLRTNGQLADWAKKNMDFVDTDDKGAPLDSQLHDLRLKRVLATALDVEILKPEQYTKMSGHDAARMKIGYVNWWITAVYDGMIAMIYACFKDQGVTKDEVLEALRKNPTMMVSLSREIEHLSAPEAGNG